MRPSCALVLALAIRIYEKVISKLDTGLHIVSKAIRPFRAIVVG